MTGKTILSKVRLVIVDTLTAIIIEKTTRPGSFIISLNTNCYLHKSFSGIDYMSKQ